MGEGFLGTIIKDIWTKPRGGGVKSGEGGGGGWVGGGLNGVNAENST